MLRGHGCRAAPGAGERRCLTPSASIRHLLGFFSDFLRICAPGLVFKQSLLLVLCKRRQTQQLLMCWLSWDCWSQQRTGTEVSPALRSQGSSGVDARGSRAGHSCPLPRAASVVNLGTVPHQHPSPPVEKITRNTIIYIVWRPSSSNTYLRKERR